MTEPKIINKMVEAIDHEATGKACRAFREAKGLTQTQVAKKLLLSKAMVSDLECGRKNWSQDRLAEYLCAINLSRQKTPRRRKG